jgi:hypothetical protein
MDPLLMILKKSRIMSTVNGKKIRLGICMAGAVSAGAYTAGVMDYLIETLERWEQRKNLIREKNKKMEPLTDEEKLIPMHEVVIEVLSGASAGGMTAAVLAYSFNDGTYINKRNNLLIDECYGLPLETDAPSKLYNSWINMVDDQKGSTFQKLMDPVDIVSMEQMKSILNSSPIDEIAQNAIPASINFQPPGYISKHLSVILTVTNLEGIPIDIRFSNVEEADPTRNVLKMHSGFLHYQFNEQNIQIDFPPEILSEKSKHHLAIAAKATGAFPFGLSNRKIVVNHLFFDEFKKRLLTNYKINVNLQLPEGKDYVFNAIDGGTINNEPIGTTVKILESKKKLPDCDGENYLILIDPFPTITNAKKEVVYNEPKEYTLLQQVSKIIDAIRNQSMFKQEDLLNGLEMEKNRFLIYPAKRKYYFLACGLIQGFAGFFKKAFRSHDYQLGRKNCQVFLRYYFGEQPEKFREITGSEPPVQQIEKWCYDANYGRKDMPSLKKIPLIPDMLVLKDRTEITTPVYDGITVEELKTVTGQIEKRMKAMVDKSYPFITEKAKGINKILGWVMKVLPGFFKKKILGFATTKINSQLDKTFYPQSIKQTALVDRYADIIHQNGQLYQKEKKVIARVSKGGEEVVSTTSDGIEAKDVSMEGDYIVVNSTRNQEAYIVKPVEFARRYTHVSGDEFSPSQASEVSAIQITAVNIFHYGFHELENLTINPELPIYIEAPWNESQTLRINDYLVCPPSKKEVYRVARQEFEQTYSAEASEMT